MASCTLAAYRVTGAASTNIGEVALNWLLEAATLAVKNMDNFFAVVLHIVTDVNILTDIRARVDDIRRKLTDSTPEHHLNVKLEEWLKHYDSWVSEKAKGGESDADFAARHEHSRIILESEWKSCAADAVLALQEIDNLHIELESVGSNAMPLEEWHRYSHLLDDEKTMFAIIKSDMPIEPNDIARVREIAQQIDRIVSIIDKYAVNLK